MDKEKIENALLVVKEEMGQEHQSKFQEIWEVWQKLVHYIDQGDAEKVNDAWEELKTKGLEVLTNVYGSLPPSTKAKITLKVTQVIAEVSRHMIKH